jgi:superfamily II DNA or RNA helicase
MLLRPRQKELVDRAVEALHQYGNTLAVAPTGAGKTIMLSAVIGALCKTSTAKTCVIAHRNELTVQNQTKFCRVNPHLSTSIFNAWKKSWQGDTTFAMVQTLSYIKNLETMPILDLLVIDEAHHARAKSYRRIVDYAKKLNPDLKLLGMTATPNRGDKKGLNIIFNNVCDQIYLEELIASGHLVKPRTFVMDAGLGQKLQDVRKDATGEFDMEEAAEIMDTQPRNQAVVAHWKEKAGDRQTVVFCSTVDHARHVYETFIAENVKAVLVYGDMDKEDRKQNLQTYASGQAQVIVNVSVLTEGWDHPPTSCVVLLRPCAYKSTFIQMVGRGLRTINQEEHPGIIKTDCLALDFGNATLIHGSLEQMAQLGDRLQFKESRENLTKVCPQCYATVQAIHPKCPLCNFEFHDPEGKPVEGVLDAEDFDMREVDLLKYSPFEWVAVAGDQETMMASGFKAWATVQFRNDQWCAIGGIHKGNPCLLAIGDKAICLATADDWMNIRDSNEGAYKIRSWLHLPPTSTQFHYLPNHWNNYDLTRYEASLLITLKFNADAIDRILNQGALQ